MSKSCKASYSFFVERKERNGRVVRKPHVREKEAEMKAKAREREREERGDKTLAGSEEPLLPRSYIYYDE